MIPLYTKLNLEHYIEKVERQKEALQLTTILSANELKELTQTYDLQIQLAQRFLNRLNENSINELDVQDALQL